MQIALFLANLTSQGTNTMPLTPTIPPATADDPLAEYAAAARLNRQRLSRILHNKEVIAASLLRTASALRSMMRGKTPDMPPRS